MILDSLFGRRKKESVFAGKTPEQIKEERKGLVPEPADIRQENLALEESVMREQETAANRPKEVADIVIEDLRDPIENILVELMPKIEAGAYSTIIGDDASGRIPTIILANVVKSVYELKNHPLPVVRFLAGSTGLNEEKEEVISGKTERLMQQVEKIRHTVTQHSEPKKVLVVTDIIETGESIRTLLKALDQNDWSADVASIGGSDKTAIQTLSNHWRTRVICGGWKGPMIYKFKELSGVQKEHDKLFAVPHPEAEGEIVRYGREQARKMAGELIGK